MSVRWGEWTKYQTELNWLNLKHLLFWVKWINRTHTKNRGREAGDETVGRGFNEEGRERERGLYVKELQIGRGNEGCRLWNGWVGRFGWLVGRIDDKNMAMAWFFWNDGFLPSVASPWGKRMVDSKRQLREWTGVKEADHAAGLFGFWQHKELNV